MMNYSNAWKCHECPERADEQGCPAWCDGIVEHNPQTGQDRVTKGCVFPIMMRTFSSIIAHSVQPASEISAMRGEVAQGLAEVGKRVQEGFTRLPIIRVAPGGQGRLEDKDG